MGQRILVVDDETSVAFFLAETLMRLGAHYQVETANSGEEALTKIEAQVFDLIVTDLKMPGISGLELIERARSKSPHTRLILMTAYGNEHIADTAYSLGACRYLVKPFQMPDLVEAVRGAMDVLEPPGRDILMFSDDRFDEIIQCISDLRFEVGAQCILLAEATGQPFARVGEMAGVDHQVLLSLIGGSFATTFEMARLLGEDQALTLNYHEGKRLDVYSANINAEMFIVLLFDRQHQVSRLGMVWLYARRAIRKLQVLLADVKHVSAGHLLDNDFGELLNDSLDELLEELPGTDPGSKSTEAEEAGPGPTEVAPASQDDVPLPSYREPAGGSVVSESTVETFDLDQAIRMGLLDSSWANRLGNGEQ